MHIMHPRGTTLSHFHETASDVWFSARWRAGAAIEATGERILMLGWKLGTGTTHTVRENSDAAFQMGYEAGQTAAWVTPRP